MGNGERVRVIQGIGVGIFVSFLSVYVRIEERGGIGHGRHDGKYIDAGRCGGIVEGF
jgi:hypothetical protein